ncbi:MAG: YcaO-like family protein, partial [Gloeotrichia echinulata HAB0833]
MGVGLGQGRRALRAALYEFEERSAAFEVPLHHSRRKLSELGSLQLSEAWSHAVKQMVLVDYFELVSEHKFTTALCLNLWDKQTVWVPSAVLTLSRTAPDSEFIPFTDSSGSALHATPIAAAVGALTEFSERQALIAFWCGRRESAKMLTYDPASDIFDCTSKTILRTMLSTGDVILVDASLDQFENVVIACFGGRRGGPVHFACGVSCKISFRDAVNKAVHELWQSAYHMELLVGAANRGRIKMSRLEENYLKGNGYDTF